MANLAVLDEPRTFPPKKFLFVIWTVTLAFALYGIYATIMLGVWTSMAWIIIAVIAFWQIWVIRWVQVDNEAIRIRNIFQRGRELRWDEVMEFREEEVKLSRKTYVILHLSNRGGEGVVRLIRMQLTNDQLGFDNLREIVRNAVPDRVVRE